MIMKKQKFALTLSGTCANSLIMCVGKFTKQHKQQLKEKKLKVKCHVCRIEFKTKNYMMLHRKVYRPESTRDCMKHNEESCGFDENECWYINTHKLNPNESSEEINVETDSEDDKRNPVPPNKRKKQPK